MTAAKQPLGTASVELGAEIGRVMKKRNWNTRRVANVCGCQVGQVEDWLAGRDVPSFSQWNSLKNAVSFELRAKTELFQRARTEQGFQPVATPPATGFGMKLLDALPPAPVAPRPAATEPAAPLVLTPDPKAETPRKGGTAPGYKYPPGSRTREKANARETFARAQLMARPHMPIGGKDGLRQLMRDRFGVGLAWDTLATLKAEITGQPAEPEPKHPEPVKTTPVAAPVVPPSLDETFETAAQMVIEAVPNLASFTITVDADGRARLAYTVREVQVVERSGEIVVGKKP